MKKNKIFILFLITLSIALALLVICSGSIFRLKLANFYENNNQPVKAIKLYSEVLRGNQVKKRLSDRAVSKINLKLGSIYEKIGLINKAIESYGRVNLGDIGKDVEYSTNGVDRDRALAVGLVESGKWDRAIKEIEKLKSIYYYDYFNSQADSYIKAVRQLERRGLCPKDKNFYFAIGDTYIENQLFGEARSFFTKRILDYGVDLRELLRYLKNKYFAQKDIVQKVWGDEIYVTLEDFEELDTKIYNWVSTNKARIISHYIDDKTYHKGLRSEWFDLYYSQENKLGDYNYLAKTVSILVFDYDFKLGIRLFIKSIVPFEYIVGVNMVRQGPGLIASGIYTSTQSRALDNGWVEYRIDNLSGGVRKIFPATKGNVLEIKIDKVAIDSKCASNKFFVDDIEIFIMND